MLHFIISFCYNSNSRTKYYTYKYSSTQIRIFPEYEKHISYTFEFVLEKIKINFVIYLL